MALFCSGCGQSLGVEARFCSACGKPVREGVGPATARGPLVRPLAGKKIAGVCQGFANQYGWDVTLTRVIAALITIATFPLGLVVYLLLWVIVPQEPQTAVAVTHLNPTS
jgi:phage shock protein C